MDSNFPCFSVQKTLTENLRHLTFAYDLNKFLNLFWNNFYQWEIIEIFDHNINKSVSVQMHSTSGSHHQNHRQKNSLCYCPKNWLHLVFVWSRLCCVAVVVIISFISWTAAVSRIFGLLENISNVFQHFRPIPLLFDKWVSADVSEVPNAQWSKII